MAAAEFVSAAPAFPKLEQKIAMSIGIGLLIPSLACYAYMQLRSKPNPIASKPSYQFGTFASAIGGMLVGWMVPLSAKSSATTPIVIYLLGSALFSVGCISAVSTFYDDF